MDYYLAIDIGASSGRHTDDEITAQINVIKTYSDGLIKNGGVSTDFFKKNLGEDTTRDFFDKAFFGTDIYRINNKDEG